MYLTVSWSMESSYETPDVRGPWENLDELVEDYLRGDDYPFDWPIDDDSLYHTKLVKSNGSHKFWYEVDDEEELGRIAALIDEARNKNV